MSLGYPDGAGEEVSVHGLEKRPGVEMYQHLLGECSSCKLRESNEPLQAFCSPV